MVLKHAIMWFCLWNNQKREDERKLGKEKNMEKGAGAS